jgi:hypothetical protein
MRHGSLGSIGTAGKAIRGMMFASSARSVDGALARAFEMDASGLA